MALGTGQGPETESPPTTTEDVEGLINVAALLALNLNEMINRSVGRLDGSDRLATDKKIPPQPEVKGWLPATKQELKRINELLARAESGVRNLLELLGEDCEDKGEDAHLETMRTDRIERYGDSMLDKPER